MAPIFKIAALLSLSLHVAAQGTQFITGACASDAECASACCGFKSGKCAAPAVAQEQDGCGFGTAAPNNNAFESLKGSGAAAAPAAPAATIVSTSVAAAPPAATGTSAAKAAGTQFITGACASDAECASACCGFKSGKCAAPAVAQEQDGCGFGTAAPNNNAFESLKGNAAGGAAAAPAATTLATSVAADAAAPAATTAAKAAGTQFITGACTKDADCNSACCGFKSGKCAGPAVAQERDGGCGFGDAQPNDNALKAITQRRRV